MSARMSTSRHVLICDEEREVRSALAAHLEHHGYRVSVTGGNALTRALERARIDLVILGVQLGEDDGLRAFRGLRAASDVPLVILARRGDEVAEERPPARINGIVAGLSISRFSGPSSCAV